MTGQGELFNKPNPTLAQAKLERDQAMAQVEEHAGETWQDYAIELIRQIANEKKVFTSDDVMGQMIWNPHDSRALGPAMKAAQKLGIIRPTDSFTLSVRRHATPIRVWEINT